MGGRCSLLSPETRLGRRGEENWGGASGSVSVCFRICNSREGPLKMQESWGPQEVRSRTKHGGAGKEPGSERRGSSFLAPRSQERRRARAEGREAVS